MQTPSKTSRALPFRGRRRSPGFGGQVGSGEDRNELLGTVGGDAFGQVSRLALRFVDGRAHEPWSAVRLCLDDEQVCGIAVVHPNQSVCLPVSCLTDLGKQVDRRQGGNAAGPGPPPNPPPRRRLTVLAPSQCYR